MLKKQSYYKIINEINEIKSVCKDKILKVIIETCLLTEEEKEAMCKVVALSNADFIKTSTGFSTSGATIEDIKLFSKNLNTTKKKIKASGGIKTIKDAEDFILAGTDRLGTSKIISLLNKEK